MPPAIGIKTSALICAKACVLSTKFKHMLVLLHPYPLKGDVDIGQRGELEGGTLKATDTARLRRGTGGNHHLLSLELLGIP